MWHSKFYLKGEYQANQLTSTVKVYFIDRHTIHTNIYKSGHTSKYLHINTFQIWTYIYIYDLLRFLIYKYMCSPVTSQFFCLFVISMT